MEDGTNFEKMNEETCREYINDRNLFKEFPRDIQIKLINYNLSRVLSNIVKYKNEYLLTSYLLSQDKL